MEICLSVGPRREGWLRSVSATIRDGSSKHAAAPVDALLLVFDIGEEGSLIRRRA
jgi:hypothetical protein